jgi:uncharacterized protein (DUF58 family)
MANDLSEREHRRELLKKIRKIEIVTSRKVNEQLGGQYHSVFKGQGMSFEDVRPYQPGDEIRFIDWNVTARSNDVYIKRFVEERELTVVLLVDLSASLRFGSVVQYKREVAAELAALLAFSAIKNGDRVGMILFTDQVEKFITPKKGRKHVLRLITEILTFEPQGKGTDLGEAFGYLSRVIRRRSVVFALSDFQADLDSFDRPLRVAARRHDLIPVVIRDKMEEELPAMGLVLVEDLESGDVMWIDTASRRIRRRYRETSALAHQSLLQHFRRLRLDSVDVETGGGYIHAVVQFFKLRARRL